MGRLGWVGGLKTEYIVHHLRFESKASASFYDKLMSKYEADPDDPMSKFNKSKPKELKDLQGAKDRVKQALRKEEEDPMIPGKRR